MIIIEVWCLPAKLTEQGLRHLHKKIVETVVTTPEIGSGYKTEKDLTCLFPPDMMKYGLGEDIFVRISCSGTLPATRNSLKLRVTRTVKKIYPSATIICQMQKISAEDIFVSAPGEKSPCYKGGDCEKKNRKIPGYCGNCDQ